MKNKSVNPGYVPYGILLLLTAILPLAITSGLNNRTDLPKGAALYIIGGLLIISYAVYVFYDFYSKNNRKKELLFIFDKQTDTYFFLLIAAAGLSTIFSVNPQTSIWGGYYRQIGFVSFIYFLLVYYIIPGITGTEKKAARILLIMEVIAVITAIYAILQELHADPFQLQPAADLRPVTNIGNSVFAGGFLMMVLPFSALNVSSKPGKFLRVFFPAVILAGIIITRTRSAYLAVIIQGILFEALYFYSLKKNNKLNGKTLRNFLFLIVSMIVLVVLVLFLLPESKFGVRILSIFSEGRNPRWILWNDAWNIFLKYPLTGPGIAMFPNALEEFYSINLRIADPKRFFDHAHNNYLQILFTMGIAGLAAYGALLLRLVYLSAKKFISERKARLLNNFYPAYLLMLAGYMVYGLTNFDEFSIMLYFFIFGGLFKVYLNNFNVPKKSVNRKYANHAAVLAAVILAAVSYNIYLTYNSISADRHYFEGLQKFSSGEIKDGVNNMNSAIMLNERCGIYRYTLGVNIYKLVSSSENMNSDSRTKLLDQALDELKKAEDSFFSLNEINAIRSMIYFELGRKEEAEEIKKLLLGRDSINVNYRVDLMYYYLGINDHEQAKENLDKALYYYPGSLNVQSSAAYYYLITGNKEESRRYCFEILKTNPGNKGATEILKLLN